MLRFRGVLAVVVAMLIGIAGTAAMSMSIPASGKPPTCVIDQATGTCQKGARPKQKVGLGSGLSIEVPPRQCFYKGRPIDCVTGLGYWRGDLQCYVSEGTQKEAEERIGDGAKKKDDQVWMWCVHPGGSRSTSLISAVSRAELRKRPPDPAQVAYQLLAEIGMRAGKIGITPTKPIEQGGFGIIGMPVYLWVDDPGRGTTGPVSASRTIGEYTVSLTGGLDKIVYDLGNGDTVTCEGDDAPGIPYDPSYKKKPSPVCGYPYYAKKGRYTVTATSTWSIEWSGVGETGEIELSLSRSIQIEMREVRVIIQRRCPGTEPCG